MNPQKRKAVSPVIATVILVAVAITVAVGVSYWMGGISSQYTQFEKVEIQTAYSAKTTGSGWLVTMNLKNSGTSAASLTDIFLNDVPLNSTAYSASAFPDGSGDQVVTSLISGGEVIGSGESQTIYVWIWNDGTNGYSTLSSGTTVNIKIHSAGGMDYIKLVELV
jgi:flagellin-like protein